MKCRRFGGKGEEGMGALSKLSQWRTLAREAAERTAILAKFLCILHVYGPSMLPTFNLTGDVLLVENLTVRMGKVRPGDVVLVRSPENPRKTVSKRILGMEGDRVTFMIDPKNSNRCQSVVAHDYDEVSNVKVNLIYGLAPIEDE
uniref:Peptidase S26 domain-containing protein n=2 Tax=Vitis vinifera TaxID=29760 RepID=A5C8D7_VITVI|nr:hypothetical protein VITISV_004497 [Vitis vinifera]